MKPDKFNYRIDKIGIHEFFVKPRPEGVSSNTIDLNYNVTITNRVVSEIHLIIQNVTINIHTEDKLHHLAGITVLIGYFITDFEKFVIINDESKLSTIDLELERLIKNISIGTSRGILFSQLQGTYLSLALLPVIPNSTLVENTTY